MLDLSGFIASPHSSSRNAIDCITGFGLRLRAAVNHRIIGVAREGTLWIRALHPAVERVMHEQIHQDRTDYAPYTKGNFQFERVVKGWRSTPILDLRLKK